VFYHNDSQKIATELSISALSATDRFQGLDIVTEVLPYTTFYPAEDYHQDYYKKAATQYKRYENASGRDEYKALIWSDIQNSAQN
jgi:peptide methionine sulfoxide reductase MsrA